MGTRWMLFGLLTAALCACTTHGLPAPAANSRTLVIGVRTEPSSLNPLMLQGEVASLVGGLMYSYLLTVDGAGNLIPDAAATVPTFANGGIAANGFRVTYRLRKNIHWQDGAPLTSRDCLFTFRAIMDSRNNIPSREGYDQIASVTAPDEYTVVVNLKRPYAPILSLFLSLPSNYPIVPWHRWKKYSDLNQVDFRQDAIGSGPFRLLEWKRGDRLVLAANATYFRGKPPIARFVIKFVPSYSTLANQLRTHEIDASPDFDDPPLYHELRAIAGSRVVITPQSGTMLIAFNTASGPTSDRNVRLAITKAVDTKLVVDRAGRGLYDIQDPLRGTFGSVYSRLATPAYDPVAARRLLERAGWKMGPQGVRTKSGHPLAMVLALSNGSAVDEVISTEVQQQLREVGADVTIKPFEPALFVASASQGGPLFGGRFGIIILPVIFSPAGPQAGSYFICSARMPAGFNFTRLCDGRFDAAYKDSVKSYNPLRQRRDVAIMEHELASQVPIIALYQLRDLSVIPQALHGYAPSVETPYVNVGRWDLDAREK